MLIRLVGSAVLERRFFLECYQLARPGKGDGEVKETEKKKDK